MAITNDYSLNFRKSDGVVETYYGYDSKVTTPSLIFRNSNGNVRYIPLENENNNNPLLIRYDNTVYSVIRQNFQCKITYDCISSPRDSNSYDVTWKLKRIELTSYNNNNTFYNGFNESCTIDVMIEAKIVKTVSAYESDITMDDVIRSGVYPKNLNLNQIATIKVFNKVFNFYSQRYVTFGNGTQTLAFITNRFYL